MSDETAKIRVTACPICGKPAVEKHRPFCSRHCSLIDLGRWFGGNYRVPEKPQDDEADSLPGEDADGSEEGAD